MRQDSPSRRRRSFSMGQSIWTSRPSMIALRSLALTTRRRNHHVNPSNCGICFNAAVESEWDGLEVDSFFSPNDYHVLHFMHISPPPFIQQIPRYSTDMGTSDNVNLSATWPNEDSCLSQSFRALIHCRRRVHDQVSLIVPSLTVRHHPFEFLVVVHDSSVLHRNLQGTAETYCFLFAAYPTFGPVAHVAGLCIHCVKSQSHSFRRRKGFGQSAGTSTFPIYRC